MTNPTFIAPGGRTYDVATAKSYAVEVEAGSSISVKAGHLVALIAGVWTAFAKTTDATAQTGVEAIGVLLNDCDLSSTASVQQVLYAGEVAEEFVRNAGIEATTTSFEALIAANSHIVFTKAEEVA